MTAVVSVTLPCQPRSPEEEVGTYATAGRPNGNLLTVSMPLPKWVGFPQNRG
jgi:hypothetical protein